MLQTNFGPRALTTNAAGIYKEVDGRRCLTMSSVHTGRGTSGAGQTAAERAHHPGRACERGCAVRTGTGCAQRAMFDLEGRCRTAEDDGGVQEN